MKKYLITFMVSTEPFAMIEIFAHDSDGVQGFVAMFYPDTNYDWQEIEAKDL